MKTDRLIAITMYLLNRETVSASVLAERFEVSKRTIQRDIDALNQAGIPIVSTYGAEGGYGIIDGFKLAKQIAGVDDYVNIITALKGLSTAYDGQKINSTLEKVLSTLKCGEQRIFIDFSVARELMFVNEHLDVIENAVNNKMLLNIVYTNAESKTTERVVEPLALSYRWYGWYLFAYCAEKMDYRLFKLARISDCKTVAGVFSKEHENIEALMKDSAAGDKRKYYDILVLCKGGVRQQVYEYLGSNTVEERVNGDFVIAMHVPLERMWLSLLLGFGNQVEVLEPAEIKEMIKEKANQILSVY